ncbi:MAG TPA: beta-galactosidase [Pyrinomonadaceae bacterium]
MKVRSSDPRFLSAARAYMLEVGKRLAPLQISRGGNIIMTQVENEYGSFGDDKAYLDEVRKIIVDAGFEVPLFTSDGSEDYQLKNGTLADNLSVINFGVDDKNGLKAVTKEFENFARFRQHVPRMVGEYWIGWFDHWGGKKHTVSPEAAAEALNWMLDHGISFNLYMFHGGTNFGFMNGANATKESQFMPDTTSYDYDATLDEAGNPTRKYFLIREVIQKHLPAGETLPEVPKSSPLIAIPEFELKETADFFSLLKAPVPSRQPLSMEDVGQSYGFILYRTKLNNDVNGRLKFENVRDYAHVFVDGRLIGQLDRRLEQTELPISARQGSTVDALVENGGRVNFGKNFVFERKGIVGNAKINSEELRNWEMFKLPLENLSSLKFANGITKKDGPVFYRGSFLLRDVGDTYLDMSSWGKGHVWVNGHHLGRYWNIGPQQSLYLPANWLRKGTNEVIVLDVMGPKVTRIRGVNVPIFRSS